MRPIVRVLATTVVAALASGSVWAADCKFDTDEVDKFTKVRTLVTRRNSLESFWGDTSKDEQKDIYVSAYYRDGYQALNLQIMFTRYVDRMPPSYELRNAIVIPKNSPLLVMMADGNIVTLNSLYPIDADARATYTSIGVSIDSGASIYYPLNDELIAALSSQAAAKIRVQAADMHYDFEVHEKSRDDIGNAIRCVQENL
jgi:hypothetical protein